MVDYICSKGKYFVTGTDTEVGKTYVTVFLLNYFRKLGWKVGAFKPVESGVSETTISDFQLLSDATGENAKTLYKLEKPLAPYIAAMEDGVEIDIEKIVDFAKKDALNYDIYFVEGAGGLMVPVTEEILMIDIIKKIGFEVILVARTNLGTVNHTLLSIEALQNRGIKINQVILNEIIKTPLENIKQNIEMIEKFSNVKVGKVIRFNENLNF